MASLKAYGITVEGEVQGVGFGRTAKKLALRHNITGSVRNQDDGTVQIIAQGEEENLASFLRSIKELKLPIQVDRDPEKTPIRISKKRAIFAIKRGSLEEELEEGLSAGQEQLVLLGNKIDVFNENTTKNFNELADRYDNISETLAKVVEESAKSREDFKTAVRTPTEAQTKQFKDGLDALTSLAREYFDERRAVWSKEKNN